MKRTLLALALTTCFSAQAATFNYHGNLQDTGKPAEGRYDIELTLYSAAEGGKVVAGPLTVHEVDVHDGSFSTEVGFPTLANVPQQAWLGVRVHGAGESEFATLGARAAVGADAVASSVCPGAWTLDGNAGNAIGSYIGTADNQPLIFKVNGSQVGSLKATATSPSVAFGASNNVASYAGATVSGGESNTASLGDATVVGGIGNTASGSYSTVGGGFHNTAAGMASFAGGNWASVRSTDKGTFLWSDLTATSAAPFTSSGINQFLVRASGGVAINGMPKDNATELSIYPSGANGANYSNMFFGNTGKAGGILISAGDESSATSNDAVLYVDEFNGTSQARKFVVNSAGATINDPANMPANNTANVAALRVVAPTGSNDALIDMYPHDPANPTLSNYWSLLADKDEFDVIRSLQPTSADSVTRKTYMRFYEVPFFSSRLPFVDVNATLKADVVSVTNDLTVNGNAYKPGGGTWSATSDRRVKQDIAPIDNAIDTLLKLRPVSFRYTPEYRAMEGGLADKSYLGFVAQEFAEVFPEAVTSTGQHVPGAAKDAKPILALDPNPALITTVAAVQELAVQSQVDASRVRALESGNAQLHRQLDALSARLSRLENGRKGE